MAPMYCCTCSSSIYDTYDMIRELLLLSKACLRYCCFSSYMSKLRFLRVRTEAAAETPLLTVKDCNMMRQNHFCSVKIAYQGQTVSFPFIHASPLFELFCRHLAHIPPLFKRAGLRMCVYDIHSPQAALQSQRADMKLSNQLQFYFVNNF